MAGGARRAVPRGLLASTGTLGCAREGPTSLIPCCPQILFGASTATSLQLLLVTWGEQHSLGGHTGWLGVAGCVSDGLRMLGQPGGAR